MKFILNSVRNFFRTKWQICVALILTFGVFGVGFYMGKQNNDIAISIDTREEKDIDLDAFWKVWDILDDRFAPASTTVPAIENDTKIYGAIAGLAASYGDPYTVFFPPVESKMFNEEISGSFSGVGMEIAVRDGTLTVVAPLKGSPAERAGVKAGDKIVRIGDAPAEYMSSDEAVRLIRGEAGTTVTVTFFREGVSEPIVKAITRAPIEIPTIATKMTPEGVFVIELYNFSAVSPNLFRSALREFVESKSDKLVLDLRDNPGGYLEAALDMASWFLPAGKVVVTEDFGDGEESEEYRSKGYDVFNDNLKMAILVNRGSASASEILAGALREYSKAILIGENTFGKGSVQELIDIDDKTSLKVTVAHWFTPNGVSISDGGLSPDITVELTEENTKGGKDPVLEAAVDYLMK